MNLFDPTKTVALASLLLASISVAQGDPKISSIGVDDASNELRLTIQAPAGELLLESSSDLNIWKPFSPISKTGSDVLVADPVATAAKFYRVTSFPDSDDTHLNGVIATELKSVIPYADLQAVFGLVAGPPASPVNLVRDLPTAERDLRVYATTIGLLSILARDLIASTTPTPSIAEVVAALAVDLASGGLNGRDSSGQLIPIGTSVSNIPEYTPANIATARATLDDELSGLRGIELTIVGGVANFELPTCWNTFYWGTADWQ